MTVQTDILKAVEGIEHGFQQTDQAFSEQIFHYRQVHSAEIVNARSLSKPERHAVDGVFSEGPLVVAVITVDYLPILTSSRNGWVVAALHDGWQGLAIGIAGAVTACLNVRGVASADIRIAIGPGIKACYYKVSVGFIEALQVGHGRLWEGTASPQSQRRPLPERPPRFAPPELRQAGQGVRPSLMALCRQLLQAVGVGSVQIEASAVCTYRSGDAFASHRRRQCLDEEKRQQYIWTAYKS